MLKRLLTTVAAFASLPAGAYTYQDDTIAFELPGKWSVEQESSAWVSVRNEKDNAQFIVAVVRVNEPMPTYETRIQNIEKLAAVRQAAILKLSSGAAVVGEPAVAEVGGQLIYDFKAKSMNPEVTIYTRLIQRNDKIASFSLFDYGARSEEQFLELVHQAFSATKLK